MFSPFIIILSVGLSNIVFILLRCVPSILTLLTFFIINLCLICQKPFLHLMRWSYDFYSSVCYVVDHTDLWLLNHPSFHSWDKSNLIMVYDLFNLLLNSFCSYFIKDFSILVRQWYWPVSFFLRGVFVWFWYQCSAGLNQFSFLEYFEKHRYWLLKCIVEFCDTIWSYTFVCWQFFLILTQFQCW